MAQIRPTFSESWYRVADLKVRLRPSAQISRQFYRGDRWYVVRDPAGNQYHRLSAPAYRFVGLLDGSRSVAEAWELVGGQLADDAPTQNEVIQILSQLHSANLIESNVTPDAAVLLRRHKKMVQRQWQGRLMNVLFPRIPIWDPDQFLKRWMPFMKYLLSPFGALLWLAVIIAAIAALVPEWTRVREAAQYSISPGNWPFLWATFVLIKAIHEIGHGFACRRFGGEVHELGIMFLVFVPAPYVDASTAWAFPSKWARIFVGAGGMIFELFVAAIMAFVWLNTNPNTLISQLAYNTMLIASVSTVIFNGNPLLRYDGYYMLSDLLEIPNLRYRSSEYSLGLIKRHLFKVKQSQPLPPIGQRFWLLFYGIASSLYRMWVGIMIIMMVWNQVPVLGVLMAIGGVATWLLVPVVKTLKYLLIDAELHRKRVRASLITGTFVAAVVVLIGVVRWNIHYEARAIVEPAFKQVIHPGAAGIVREIRARDGQQLKKGDVILVLQDRELELRITELQAELDATLARLDMAAVYSQVERQALEFKRDALRKAMKTANDRLGRLVIAAPEDGTLIAPEIHHWLGKYIREADEVGTVARMDTLRVVACFDQADAALTYVKDVSWCDVRLASDRSRGDLKATVDRTAEGERMATATMELYHPGLGQMGGGDIQTDPTDPKGVKLMRPHVLLWYNLQNPSQYYVPGQVAHVRFELGREPLIRNWSRRLWQLIQTHSNTKWL